MENNWTIAQTKELFALVRKASDMGRGLGWAFEEMAKKSNRSANSVRNFYYSQLKMFQLLPSLARDLNIELPDVKRDGFELFTREEICFLVESVLVGKAQGRSVRAVIAELSGGDSKKALRLQNKYRSMLTHHRALVEEIMDSLAKRNIAYYDPFRRKVGPLGESEDNVRKLGEYISRLDEREAGDFLKLIRKLM